MRLYQDEYGVPMNMTSVVAHALSVGSTILRQSRTAIGFTYIYDGFRKEHLAPGVQRIRHQFPLTDESGGGGTGIARTTIMINFGGGVGPLGGALAHQSTRRSMTLQRAEIFQTTELERIYD